MRLANPSLGHSLLLCVNHTCLLAIVSPLVAYPHHCRPYVWLVSASCTCDLQQQFLTSSHPSGFTFALQVHVQLQSSITTCAPCSDGRKTMQNVNRSLWDVTCKSIPGKTHVPQVIIPQLILLRTTLDPSGQLMAKEVQLHSSRTSAGKSHMWCECHDNKNN